MTAHDGSRNILSDGTENGFCDSFALGRCGNGADQVRCVGKGGNGQRQRMGRNLIKRRKASVVYLLHPADLIELDDLDDLGVIKECKAGVIERDVTVLTDTETNKVGRILL